MILTAKGLNFIDTKYDDVHVVLKMKGGAEMADDHGPISNSDEHCEAFYELPLCATLKIAVMGL